MKKCGKCKENRDLSLFGKSKQTKDGFKCYCNICKREESAAWREKNSPYSKKYRKEHKEEAKEYQLKYRQENKEAIYKQRKESLAGNILRQRADKKRKKSWYEANKERIIDRKRERRHSNIQLRLAENLRSRLYKALKNNQKNGSAVKDLGCSIEEFKLYLESKFQDNMTWENYGKWHIDHIIPISSFDLTNSEQVKQSCHYTNLQPL